MTKRTNLSVLWYLFATFTDTHDVPAWWHALHDLDVERAWATYRHLRDNFDTHAVTVDQFLAVYEVGVPA